MDTKIIEQYGEDILCYRLRTARQRKRMQYEDFDKFLIQLDKKETALYRQIRNLGWEPLQPPVQKGWVRCFVLRDDVAKQKHAAFFESILKKINTYQYDWRKDFKKKKRKLGRKIYVAKQQFLLTPGEWHFKRMNFSEAEQQFFYEGWELDCYKRPIKRFVFREPWRFVLTIKPNIIYEVRKRDVELESALNEIINYLQRNDLRKRLGKILDGAYQYRRWDRTDSIVRRMNLKTNPFVSYSI
jgi:hypothetical protein